QEKEFFATRDHRIANAPNKAARERLIEALSAPGAPAEKRALAAAWHAAKHTADCEGKFVRESGRYPLTAFGDINTYAIFSETFLRGARTGGRAGFIVPTGIATDATNARFFSALINERDLIRLTSFENEEFIFPGVHHSVRFSLITTARSFG